jgi:hypothetical protein
MSPDPYAGSYDMNNPQSFNRYSYVLNNPMTLTDPSGQEACLSLLLGTAAFGEGGEGVAIAGCAVDGAIGLYDLFSKIFSGGPSFHGSLQPRPGVANDPGSFGESLGIPTSIPQGNWGIGMAFNLPSECEFGACGAGPSSLTPGQAVALGDPILIPPSWLVSVANLFHFPYADVSDPNHRLFGTHHCGPGGGGDTTGGLDGLCAAHDACYRRMGVSWTSNLNPFTSGAAMGECDILLCAELKNLQPTSTQEARGRAQIYQAFQCDNPR